MRKVVKARAGVGALAVAIVAPIVWFSMGSANPRAARVATSDATPAHDCAVWVDTIIPTGIDRLTVTAKYAEPIGEISAGKFADAARVEVVSAMRSPTGEPQAAQVVLNTGRAVAGKWLFTLTGDTGTCSGDVYVGR